MRTVPTVMALCRPSTFFPVGDSKVVDGRAKPGHDGWCSHRAVYVKISGFWYQSCTEALIIPRSQRWAG